MRKFWMVYGTSGTAPVYRHDSLCQAKVEAERLAVLHRGCTFVVLEAVEAVKATDVSWATLDECTEVPF